MTLVTKFGFLGFGRLARSKQTEAPLGRRSRNRRLGESYSDPRPADTRPRTGQHGSSRRSSEAELCGGVAPALLSFPQVGSFAGGRES